MFRKITAFSISLFLLLVGGVLYFSIQIQPTDAPHYRKLVQESAELRSKHALERDPAHQIRTGVQKDIWSQNGKERSHFRLNSEESDLTIAQKKDQFEVTETLQHITCSMGPKPNELLVSAQNGYFKFQKEAFALHLKGDVRLMSRQIEDKQSFALADTLTFEPIEKILILSADAPKKVLFWQDDLRLSASQITIRKDPITKEEAIEGVGDVHFAFDLEEENAIHQLFRNFL